jgi:hypothetical protein
MLPILIVLAIGLLPTITVLITDYKNQNKLMIIGCFNMAGVFIYIFSVIHKYSIHSAVSIASDVFNLIVMLGSAAIGAALYMELPKFFLSYSKISADKRLKQIDEKLVKIEEEWGGAALKSRDKKLKVLTKAPEHGQDRPLIPEKTPPAPAEAALEEP